MDRKETCPVCTHKSILKGNKLYTTITQYICKNCSTVFTEDTYTNYIKFGEDNYKKFEGPRTKELVTPTMRAAHFEDTGQYVGDIEIWAWHKERES